MIKVKTVGQYKVLQFIQKNFYPDNIDISIVDEVSLLVTDTNDDNIVFKWDGSNVIWDI